MQIDRSINKHAEEIGYKGQRENKELDGLKKEEGEKEKKKVYSRRKDKRNRQVN